MTTNKFPKTQAATLAYLKKIDDTGAPAYEHGSKVPPGTLHLSALRPLMDKGLIRYSVIQMGDPAVDREITYVILTDAGYAAA